MGGNILALPPWDWHRVPVFTVFMCPANQQCQLHHSLCLYVLLSDTIWLQTGVSRVELGS